MAPACNGPLLAECDGLRVIDCLMCGFAHLETMPDATALERFYASEFWTREKPGALAQIEERRDWWTATHGDWLELIERHAPGRMLLDVGCGYGHFLRAAFLRRWFVDGIEPSLEAVKYAQTLTGHAPWCGTWDNEAPEYDLRAYPVAGKNFDCISALWLIEHLPDPLRFMRWCHARLVNGGVLLAVVPNDFTSLQRSLNTSGKVAVPWWLVHHTHLNYFTPVTFANLLGRAGFRVVEQTTTYPMENFLAKGMDYTADAALGAELHGRIEAQDLGMTRADRIEFYQLMAQRGEGREIVFVGVKDE